MSVKFTDNSGEVLSALERAELNGFVEHITRIQM